VYYGYQADRVKVWMGAAKKGSAKKRPAPSDSQGSIKPKETKVSQEQTSGDDDDAGMWRFHA
jgi:hypothetical protein